MDITQGLKLGSILGQGLTRAYSMALTPTASLSRASLPVRRAGAPVLRPSDLLYRLAHWDQTPRT